MKNGKGKNKTPFYGCRLITLNYQHAHDVPGGNNYPMHPACL